MGHPLNIAYLFVLVTNSPWSFVLGHSFLMNFLFLVIVGGSAHFQGLMNIQSLMTVLLQYCKKLCNFKIALIEGEFSDE